MRKIKHYLNTKVIGLTGGIGSGQTSAARIFKKLGCKTIDVDMKAKEVIRRDNFVKSEIRKTFGNDVFFRDGRLNRKKLAEIVFNDSAKIQLLNKIVHPRMVEKMVEEMETARFSGNYPLVIVDAALIYEISIESIFDQVIVVYCDKKQRIRRVMQRDNMTKEHILARMNQQIPLEDKRKWADFVIENRGSQEVLEKNVEKIFDQLVADIKVRRKIRV